MDKRYTIEEANALLPLIRQELRQLQDMADELEEQYIAYRKLKAVVQGKPSKEDPLFELESKLDFLQIELNQYVENFTRKGILLKSIEPGLIDFPAVVEGEEVLLCWKEGEASITHYHGWNDGFIGRKRHPEA
ncbi:DUF2203 family protein [Paenibacillus nanensis]|uniref:DUF2203 family protein n=1 Tax=Paenibacillus nanensis TaxID=393251 RepID=A0A3A1UK65_9BACL|nr:DUF2203 domain-containing protein [Paenibacillus nanensis]RIX46028.1 DUF2203 family protein [Paenibacillus nanensis]